METLPLEASQLPGPQLVSRKIAGPLFTQVYTHWACGGVCVGGVRVCGVCVLGRGRYCGGMCMQLFGPPFAG